MDPRSFIIFLQFLKYAESLDFETKYLNKVKYRNVVFQVRDFLKFQNPGVPPESHNQYQLEKMKDFLLKLQNFKLSLHLVQGLF